MKPKFRVRVGIVGSVLFAGFFITVLLIENFAFPDPFFGGGITQLTIIALFMLSIPAAIAGFVCGGMLGGFWRETHNNKTNGIHFQIGLAAIIVLVVTIGFLLWANFSSIPIEGAIERSEYGWPAPFLFFGEMKGWAALYRINNGGISISSIAGDILFWIFLLTVIAFITERLSIRGPTIPDPEASPTSDALTDKSSSP